MLKNQRLKYFFGGKQISIFLPCIGKITKRIVLQIKTLTFNKRKFAFNINGIVPHNAL